MKTSFTRTLCRMLSMGLAGAVSLTLFVGCTSKPVVIEEDDEMLYQQSFGTSTTAGSDQSAGDGTGDETIVEGEATLPDGRPNPSYKPHTSSTTKGGGTTKPNPGMKRTIAQVKKLGGVPRLYINNQLSTANMFFINGDMGGAVIDKAFKRQVSYASNHGINLFSTIYNVNYTYKESVNKDLIFSGLKTKFDTILSVNEDAQILLRLSVIGNKASFGDSEMALYKGTQSNRVSIASDKWIEETVARVKDLVTYVRSQEAYASHVFGYHLDYGEWFPESFTECVDTSPTNTREFRQWLTAKYKTDAALQQAWGINTYTLSTATVPEDQISPKHDGVLLSKTDTRYADYYDYWNELTASRVNAIAKAIKEASNNENVVLSFYGYYFEQYHATTGHWDFRSLLESQYLDGFASPTTYMDRNGGNPNVATSGYMSTVDSVVRAGKLWVMESDERTFLNTTKQPGDTNPYVPLKTIGDIQEVHKREIGIAMAHATSMYPMDLSGRGWYDKEDIWTNFGKLDQAYMAYAKAMKKLPSYEVALVVDEDAGRLISRAFDVANAGMPRAMLDIYRAGISFALVELDDVLLGRADDYKTYIFVNPYRLSSGEMSTLADKLHRNNKTSVYLYSFGNASATDVKKLTGMDMKTVNTKSNHTLSLLPQNKIVGLSSLPQPSANPLTTVTGGYTTALGKYNDGSIGAAIYEGNGYQSVFIGTNGLGTPESIRALARYGNANVFIETKDVLVANDTMVMLHASSTGNKTVKFGGKVDVYDYFANKWYTNVDSVTLSNMKSATCRWLFYGKKAEIEAMKLPVW